MLLANARHPSKTHAMNIHREGQHNASELLLAGTSQSKELSKLAVIAESFEQMTTLQCSIFYKM